EGKVGHPAELSGGLTFADVTSSTNSEVPAHADRADVCVQNDLRGCCIVEPSEKVTGTDTRVPPRAVVVRAPHDPAGHLAGPGERADERARPDGEQFGAPGPPTVPRDVNRIGAEALAALVRDGP